MERSLKEREEHHEVEKKDGGEGGGIEKVKEKEENDVEGNKGGGAGGSLGTERVIPSACLSSSPCENQRSA